MGLLGLVVGLALLVLLAVHAWVEGWQEELEAIRKVVRNEGKRMSRTPRLKAGACSPHS